jgi:hypothetical protein
VRRPQDARLAGESQPARVAAQPLTLEGGNRREVLGPGQHFDTTGGTEAVAAAHVAMLYTSVQDSIEQALLGSGAQEAIAVTQLDGR